MVHGNAQCAVRADLGWKPYILLIGFLDVQVEEWRIPHWGACMCPRIFLIYRFDTIFRDPSSSKMVWSPFLFFATWEYQFPFVISFNRRSRRSDEERYRAIGLSHHWSVVSGGKELNIYNDNLVKSPCQTNRGSLEISPYQEFLHVYVVSRR